MSIEILDTPIPKNQPNNPFVSKKGNYVSFNSSNPFTYNPFAYNRRRPISLERGIIKEVKDGKVIIRYWDRTYDQKVHFRRKSDQVKLFSQTYLYLRCAGEPRVPWFGSEGCIKPKITPLIKLITALQRKPLLQHKMIPTLDTLLPSPTKLLPTTTKLTLHHSNHVTSRYFNKRTSSTRSTNPINVNVEVGLILVSTIN